MSNKKLFTIWLCIILILLAGIATAFAWYVNMVDTATSFELTSANVSSKTILYKGIDFDYDGYLDIDSNSDPKFTEVEKVEETSEGKTKSFFDITMTGIMPSYTYTFKVNVENNGDVGAYVSMLVEKNVPSYMYTKVFSVSVSRTDFLGFSSKVFLGSLTGSDDYLSVYSDADNVVSCTKPDNKHDYLIRFKMETFDVLKEEGILTDSDYAAYQALQGQTFEKFDFFQVLLSSSRPE